MIRQILLWILSSLEQSLDPDLKNRVDALKQKVAAAEEEEKRLQGEIAQREESIRQLTLQRAGIQLELRLEEGKIDELVRRRQDLEQVARNEQKALDSLSDHDRVRVDL